MNVRSGTWFRARLGQKLADAGIHTSVLWKQLLDSPPNSAKLAGLLNSHNFSLPEELARSGYTNETVERAIRSAEATLEASFQEICALAASFPPVHEEPPPAESARENDTTVAAAPPLEQEEAPKEMPQAMEHLQPLPSDDEFIL